jgi:uncharacterized membrane protein YhhN
LFGFSLVANIIAGLLENQWLEYISKPLIVVFLAIYFILRTKANLSPLKKWILFALFFSWVGDVLLMFQQKDPLFFLSGLSAFLIAHIFYIVFFHRVRVAEQLRSNPWFLLIVVIYYVALVSFLSPTLGDMKMPVRVYGIVISFMFMLALHMLYIREKTAGKWMMTGAGLFILSDSILAINKFYYSFDLAGLFIMLSYGAAQYFIIEGAARYMNSADKE